jgi:hypothetical protein
MKNEFTDEKRALLFGLFSLALCLRLLGISEQSYSCVEALRLTHWEGAFSWQKLSHFLKNDPPLSFIITSLWNLVSSEPWWTRLLPAMASAFTVVFAYLLVEIKVTRATALVAAFLLCLNPMSIRTGQEYSGLALAAFFVTASAYYAAVWLGTHGERGKTPMAVFAVLAFYTHYFAWAYLIFLLLAYFSTSIRPGFRRIHAYGPMLAILAAIAPLVPIIAYQVVQIETVHYASGLWRQFRECALFLPFGSSPYIPPVFSPAGALLLKLCRVTPSHFLLFCASVVFLVGAFGGWRHPFLGFLFLAPLSAGVLAGAVAPVFRPQDLVVFVPAGLACVAAGIGEVSRRSKPGRIFAGGFAVAFVGLSLLSLWDYRYNLEYKNTDWRAARLIFRDAKPRQWIVTYSHSGTADLEHYSTGPWLIKPLAPDNMTALRMGAEELASRALAIARVSDGVILLDRDVELFDPDFRVASVLRVAFGNPRVFRIPGGKHDRVFFFGPIVDTGWNSSLTWLTSWPRPWFAW